MMTEAQWLAYRGEPKVLLAQLGSRATKRKRRLFGCACCRRIWHLIGEEKARAAVLVAERFADGLATSAELQAARVQAEAIAQQQVTRAAWACANVVHPYEGIAVNASYNARNAVQAHALRDLLPGPLTLEVQALMGPPWEEESAAQCDLVRDLFGNPFRPLPPRKGKRTWGEERSRWLTWNGGTVHRLAEMIHDQRCFQDLPVLADALEEAGCNDQDILAHCRQEAEHILGCWVVDTMLGKK